MLKLEEKIDNYYDQDKNSGNKILQRIDALEEKLERKKV